MAVQRLSVGDRTILEKPGIRSEQVVWPMNAPDAACTITRVTMDPGATSTPHSHQGSEQTWIVEEGTGLLLGSEGPLGALRPGDVVRTPAGEVHGVTNEGDTPFVYLAVTTPPADFRRAYRSERRP